MSLDSELQAILAEALNIDKQDLGLSRETRLFGGIPEFDSMAVVTILTAVEERFGFVIDDDEVDASIFETIGTLAEFVESKIS